MAHKDPEKVGNRLANNLPPEILRGDVSSKAIATTKRLAAETPVSVKQRM